MDDIQRGVQAQALLENSLFRECLDRLDAEYTAAWRNAKTPEAREDCWRYVKCVEKIVTHLQSVANTGAIKQRDIEMLEGQRKKKLWPIAI